MDISGWDVLATDSTHSSIFETLSGRPVGFGDQPFYRIVPRIADVRKVCEAGNEESDS